MEPIIYFEKVHVRTKPQIAAEVIASHYAERCGLGPALVVCEKPAIYEKLLEQSWQQRWRSLQKQRDKTNDADQKLTLTEKVIALQAVRVGKAGNGNTVSVVDRNHLSSALVNLAPWTTMYCIDMLPPDTLQLLTQWLKAPMMLVADTLPAQLQNSVILKQELMQRASDAWGEIVALLKSRSVSVTALATTSLSTPRAVNEALEYLLDEHATWELLTAYQHYSTLSLQAAPHALTAKQKAERRAVEALIRQLKAFSNPRLLEDIHHNVDASYLFHDSASPEVSILSWHRVLILPYRTLTGSTPPLHNASM